MLQSSPNRLADEVMECYASWRQACAAVEWAYAAWREALRGERRLACAAHVAALDGEQYAAQAYARALDRLTLRHPPVRPVPEPQQVAS